MAQRDIELLLLIGTDWTDMGPSKRTRRERTPRGVLQRLLENGYVHVRTATYSYWKGSEADDVGPRVEARLTPQGEDVQEVLRGTA